MVGGPWTTPDTYANHVTYGGGVLDLSESFLPLEGLETE
jgi:hypothetical protein